MVKVTSIDWQALGNTKCFSAKQHFSFFAAMPYSVPNLVRNCVVKLLSAVCPCGFLLFSSFAKMKWITAILESIDVLQLISLSLVNAFNCMKPIDSSFAILWKMSPSKSWLVSFIMVGSLAGTGYLQNSFVIFECRYKNLFQKLYCIYDDFLLMVMIDHFVRIHFQTGE